MLSRFRIVILPREAQVKGQVVAVTIRVVVGCRFTERCALPLPNQGIAAGVGDFSRRTQVVGMDVTG